MINLALIGLVAFFLYGWFDWMPFDAEVQAAVNAVIPYSALLLALLLLRGSIQAVTTGVGSILTAIWKAIVAVFLFIVFLLFLFPVMLADTLLLGWLGQWMWKYQMVTIALIILSGFGYYFAVGGTEKFLKLYLGTAIALGVVTIIGSALMDWTNSTHRLTFKFQPGKTFIDPAGSIEVKAGDKITVAAFGQTEMVSSTGVLMRYSPQGDLEDLLPAHDINWYRPRGEIMLSVEKLYDTPMYIPLTNVEAGVRDIAGFDSGFYTGGYWVRGEAAIPAGVSGRLGVRFWGIDPDG